MSAAASQEALRDDPLTDIGEGAGGSPQQLQSTSTKTKATSSGSKNINPAGIGAQYSMRSPAVKRLLKEAMEMAKNEDAHLFHAQPLEDNLFEWHFTFRGPPDSPYNNGIYHGRVIFPSQYPLSPPEIALLTPSGRFETGTKICLSISNYHPETWQPSWSIRTALTALRSFMSLDSPGAIGSLECSEHVRRQMANASMSYKCHLCGPTANLLGPAPEETEHLSSPKTDDKNETSEKEAEQGAVSNSGDDTNRAEGSTTSGPAAAPKEEIRLNEAGGDTVPRRPLIIDPNRAIPNMEAYEPGVRIRLAQHQAVMAHREEREERRNRRRLLEEENWDRNISNAIMFVVLVIVFLLTRRILIMLENDGIFDRDSESDFFSD